MLQCSVCRFSGVLVSHLLSPATVILTSLGCSLLTAALLLLSATHSLASLYTGVGAMGYFVSLQFASGDRIHFIVCEAYLEVRMLFVH